MLPTDTRNLSRALHRIDVDAAGLINALQDLVDREIWKTPCRLQVRPSFHIEMTQPQRSPIGSRAKL